jgi:hypothetical protein
MVFAKDLNYNPSLYIRRAFLVYLTAFFKDNPKLGYAVYNENSDVDSKHRSLLVTGAYNMTLPDRGKLPAIFLERGPIDSGAISGASRYLKQGRGEHSEIYKTLLSTTIICHCLADGDEETDRIANLVRVGVEMDYTYFTSNYGMEVKPSRVDHVQILRPDVYRSSVMVPVMLEVGFDISKPQGETLREIELHINNEYRGIIT